jgi:RHS repeat-associated protein
LHIKLYRDLAGKIIRKVETLDGNTTDYRYIYDQRERLIPVKKNSVVIERYTYDHNGNRVLGKINGLISRGSYTLDDNLIVYADNSYRYDDDGYLAEKTTPKGTTHYTYGTLGELREVQTPTQTITYQHNANNQRVAKLIDGEVVEKYLWADLTTLLAIYDANDNLKQRFEYANDRVPTSMTMGSEKYYLHYDQVGSLRAVSDSKHNIIKEVVYDTFGNILSDSNEAFRVPFGFAGGLYDSDTKLTRFGYRDYDAFTGKWTAKDPIGFDGGDSNLYGYVLGDPVNFVDPMGLTPSSMDCIKSCVIKHYELGVLGLGLGIGGLPLISTRVKPGGATTGTSPISKGLAIGLGNTRLPWRLPAPTLKLGTKAKTAVLGRLLGRWIPLVGWGLLSYDITTISICVKKCKNDKKCL